MPASSSTGEETEKAIRLAAIKVIAKHGFKAASLREIAREVGIQAPSLYNYIKSKERLLFELLKAPLHAMIADYKALTAGVSDPMERVRAFVQVHLDFHLNDQLVVFIGNMELRSLSTPHYRVIKGLRDEYAQGLMDAVDDGVKAGVFHAQEPKVVTLAMLGMLSGVCNWYRAGGPMSASEMTELHMGLVYRMLGVQSSKELVRPAASKSPATRKRA
jgi:AcrR family transcriptional regulator